MVTNQQVRILMKAIKTEITLSLAAAKAGMDEKTARKYRRSGKLASEMAQSHTWRTRPDPFKEVWEELRDKLEDNAGFGGQDLVRRLTAALSGAFFGRSAAHAATTREGVAGSGGPAKGGDVRAGA